MIDQRENRPVRPAPQSMIDQRGDRPVRPSRTSLRRAVVAGAILLLAAGCAKQGRPSGGPVDRTAPTVAGHTPAADATRVPESTMITVDFSEAMDRQRVEEAVFVTPHGDLDMDWSGRQLRIQVRGGLTAGRTYVVIIGTAARDLHSNRLESSFSLAFATGDRLDSGELEGRIISVDDTPQRGAYVWAYDLETFDGRTARDDRAYVTQTGADGSYRFERLAQGRYRVIGFVDGNRNQTPDASEPLALPAGNVDVAGDGVTSAGDQRLAQRGVQPKVVRASAIHVHSVLLVFDRPVEAGDLEVELGALAIEGTYSDPVNANRLYVQTADQQEGTTYAVLVRRAGDVLEVPDEPVSGTAREDQKAPAVSRVEPSRSVASAAGVDVFFSEAMDTTRVPAGWTGADSTSSPPGRWVWTAPDHLAFTADTMFTPETHQMQLDLRALRDRAGNVAADSTANISFDVLTPEALATVTGLSVWPGEAEGRARIRLRDGTRKMDTTADSVGHFTFTHLTPGEYITTAWLDRDGDGAWDAGWLEPYRPAEPFVLHGEVRLEPGDTVSLALPRTAQPAPGGEGLRE